MALVSIAHNNDAELARLEMLSGRCLKQIEQCEQLKALCLELSALIIEQFKRSQTVFHDDSRARLGPVPLSVNRHLERSEYMTGEGARYSMPDDDDNDDNDENKQETANAGGDTDTTHRYVRQHPKQPPRDTPADRGGVLASVVVTQALRVGFDVTDPALLSRATSQIPSNAFGVFVSVRRGPAQSIRTWPENVHGCIGWWQRAYQATPATDLLQHTMSSANRAVWHDDRRSYFGPLESDGAAIVELDFMMRPVWRVDARSGTLDDEAKTKFSNSKYGLIVVDNETGQAATYLPRVFSANTPWSELTAHLKSKASITSTTTRSVRFYAYKIVQFRKTLLNWIADGVFAREIWMPRVFEFVNRNYSSLVPYAVDAQGHVERDRSEFVRNVATISDLYEAHTKLSSRIQQTRGNRDASALSPRTLDAMKANVREYAEMYESLPDKWRQASAFLLLALSQLNVRPDLVRPIATRLYEQLNDMDPVFEHGEALVALQTVAPRIQELDQEAMRALRQRDTDDSSSSSSSSRSRSRGDRDIVFQLNWESQFVGLHGGPVSKALTMAARLLNESAEYVVQKRESNYLAVVLEGLSSVLALLYGNGDTPSELYVHAQDRICQLFCELMRRTNDHGLVQFAHGVHGARLDITGHVLQALFALQRAVATVSHRTNASVRAKLSKQQEITESEPSEGKRKRDQDDGDKDDDDDEPDDVPQEPNAKRTKKDDDKDKAPAPMPAIATGDRIIRVVHYTSSKNLLSILKDGWLRPKMDLSSEPKMSAAFSWSGTPEEMDLAYRRGLVDVLSRKHDKEWHQRRRFELNWFYVESTDVSKPGQSTNAFHFTPEGARWVDTLLVFDLDITRGDWADTFYTWSLDEDTAFGGDREFLQRLMRRRFDPTHLRGPYKGRMVFRSDEKQAQQPLDPLTPGTIGVTPFPVSLRANLVEIRVDTSKNDLMRTPEFHRLVEALGRPIRVLPESSRSAGDRDGDGDAKSDAPAVEVTAKDLPSLSKLPAGATSALQKPKTPSKHVQIEPSDMSGPKRTATEAALDDEDESGEQVEKKAKKATEDDTGVSFAGEIKAQPLKDGDRDDDEPKQPQRNSMDTRPDHDHDHDDDNDEKQKDHDEKKEKKEDKKQPAPKSHELPVSTALLERDAEALLKRDVSTAYVLLAGMLCTRPSVRSHAWNIWAERWRPGYLQSLDREKEQTLLFDATSRVAMDSLAPHDRYYECAISVSKHADRLIQNSILLGQCGFGPRVVDLWAATYANGENEKSICADPERIHSVLASVWDEQIGPVSQHPSLVFMVRDKERYLTTLHMWIATDKRPVDRDLLAAIKTRFEELHETLNVLCVNLKPWQVQVSRRPLPTSPRSVPEGAALPPQSTATTAPSSSSSSLSHLSPLSTLAAAAALATKRATEWSEFDVQFWWMPNLKVLPVKATKSEVASAWEVFLANIRQTLYDVGAIAETGDTDPLRAIETVSASLTVMPNFPVIRREIMQRMLSEPWKNFSLTVSYVSNYLHLRPKMTQTKWNIYADRLVGQGTRDDEPGFVFNASPAGTPATEEPRYVAKIKRIPLVKQVTHRHVTTLAENIVVAVYMGELCIGPRVHDAWMARTNMKSDTLDRVFRFRKKGSQQHSGRLHTLQEFMADDGYTVVVMDKVPGITIQKWIMDHQEVPPKEAIDRLFEKAKQMWSVRLLHNDLLAQNVILTNHDKLAAHMKRAGEDSLKAFAVDQTRLEWLRKAKADKDSKAAHVSPPTSTNTPSSLTQAAVAASKPATASDGDETKSGGSGSSTVAAAASVHSAMDWFAASLTQQDLQTLYSARILDFDISTFQPRPLTREQRQTDWEPMGESIQENYEREFSVEEGERVSREFAQDDEQRFLSLV